MLKNFYYWLHKKLSKPVERGEYSAGFWQEAIREKVFSLCSDTQGRILEVGCGEGLFLSKIAQPRNNMVVFGVDLWWDILIKAKNRCLEQSLDNVKIIQADAQTLPFKSDFFDRVVCINVFFNLPDENVLQSSLQEIARVTKSGGRVVFDMRNSMNPFLFLKYKLAKYYDETVKDLPLRTYRFKKVTSYIARYNFKVVNKISIGFPWNRFAPIFIVEAQKK